MTSYTSISLNELPAHSPWPARLLGLEPWSATKRDSTKIEEEYAQGNYKRCLELFEQRGGNCSMDDLRSVEFGTSDQQVVISHGDELALSTLPGAYKEHYRLLERAVAPHVADGDMLVELGCGYGYNLALLKERLKKQVSLRGGEYAETGVTLGGKFFEDSDTRIEKFDFYSSTYSILEDTEAPLVIFTAHAIEQIPDISNMFDALSEHRAKIKAVVHIEPVYEFQGEGLLGLLRKRYIEVCDYNRNLYTQIESRADIQIDVCEKNIFGINGINPSSVILWHFT